MMKNNWILICLIGLFFLIGTTLFFMIHPNSSKKASSPNPTNPVKVASTSSTPNPPTNPPKKTSHPTKKPKSPSKPKPTQLIFGIDTANAYTSQVSQCVAKTYEKPKLIGRYLETKTGYFSGLTKKEIQFIHKKGAKLLPIYNHYTTFVGTTQGKRSANEALSKAKQLGIPKGKIIVIDIEPKRKLNADFLVSWSQTLKSAGYKPGIYGDFGDSNLRSIYLEARHKSSSMKTTILWTNTPDEGTLHKPTSFKGKSPDPANTFVWQYGVDQPCKIDSDLVKSSLLKDLW